MATGGAWRATVQGVTKESDTTDRATKQQRERLGAVLDGELLQRPRGLREVLHHRL